LRDKYKAELNTVIPHIVAFFKIALDMLKLMRWIVAASLLWETLCGAN